MLDPLVAEKPNEVHSCVRLGVGLGSDGQHERRKWLVGEAWRSLRAPTQGLFDEDEAFFAPPTPELSSIVNRCVR